MKQNRKIDLSFIQIMRFTILQLLGIMLTYTVIHANNPIPNSEKILNKKISIHFENITLKNAIAKIESKADVHFTYNPKEIATNQKVSLKAENELLEIVCSKLFYPLHIEFKVIKNSDILLINKSTSGFLRKKIITPKKKLVRGIITDKNQEPLIGATVVIKGTPTGTTTDLDGNFSLNSEKLPLQLNVSYTGFLDQTVMVNERDAEIKIKLTQESVLLDQIVVGASRHTERIIEAPVTIEKLEGIAILTSSAESVFESLTNLKGVQMMKGSLSGPVINMRGFSNMNNFRVLMHLDGMDVTSPSFGVYANIGGVSSLDLQSIEIIPGSSSALYGANAFNGILLAKSKDPFLHQGIGVQLKTGITVQDAGGINPYNNLSFRIAKSYNNKFAIKLDYETLLTNDWVSNDYSERNRNQDPLIPPDRNPVLTSPDQATYDGVNIYGDGDGGDFTRVFSDAIQQVTTSGGIIHDWNLGTLSRTGYREQDIFNNAISNHRINAALFYKINEDFRLEGLFKYGSQDLILRHTTSYPFYNFTLQQQKLELKGKGLTARVYTNFQEPKETWIAAFTAASIQSQLLSNHDWGQRFVDAYYGEVNDNATGNIQTARAYADAGMAPIGSPEYNKALRATVESGNIYTTSGLLGSRLFDNSWFWHTDLLYDFNELIKDPNLTLKLGGSYRQYSLRSEGTFYSDHRRPEYEKAGFYGIGYNGNIRLLETSVYGQVAKRLLNDRLNLSFVGRINGHSSFVTNFTPQVSTVFSPDKKRNHNIRASLATGVRNPGLQEQYLNFQLSPSFVILGGIDDNLDNYVDLFNGLTGDDIRQAFKNELGYDHQSLKPERSRTLEIGYKGLLADDKLIIDISGYSTRYKNFVQRANLVITAPTTGNANTYAIYANVESDVTSKGVGISLEYAVKGTYKIYTNYQFSDFQLTSISGKFSDLGFFSPAFNTPKNRINFGVAKRNTESKIGFDIAARYASEWTFISPIGKGYIPSLFTIDASVAYRWNNFNFTLGASNLNRNEHRTIIGGPKVGSLYTLSMNYNLKYL